MRFDLTALPADAVIRAAQLQLYLHAADGAPDGLAVYLDVLTGSWSEGGVTWETRPTARNLDVPPTYVRQTTGWWEWNVTGLIQDWVAHSDHNYGVLLRGDGATLGLRTFYAREGDTPPRLVIDYSTPTPTATRTPTPSCTQVSINADADSWADQGQPTANHGTETSLIVGKAAVAASNRVILAHFNVSSLPAGTWVDYAWLELYQTGAGGPAQYGVWVEALTARWGETTMTWAKMPPAVDVGVPPRTVPSATGVWRRWDAKILAQGWAAGDGPVAGVRLRGDGETTGSRTFAARESANPPRLVVCYRVDTTPPTNPHSFAADHTVNQWSNNPWISGHWDGAADAAGSGVAGYSFLWDSAPATLPDTVVDTTGTSASATRPDGSTYFHLRTKDNVGNWTATVHFGPIRIDTTPPTTQISAPAQVASKTFTVSWSGSDAGSGVKHYEVRYRDNTVASPTWQTLYAATTLTSHSFTGLDGHKYIFQARATDQLGNVPAWSAVPSATTAIATVDFSALGLEVTQGIQDMNNSVRLVQDRRTFARFHVRAAAGDHGPVKAPLNLYRDSAFVQAILPSNPGGSITVRQNPDRGQLADSFYFDLPTSWLHGAITLEARLSTTRWAQTNTANDTASATVAFEYVPPLDVTLVDVGYILNGTPYTVPFADRMAQASWLRRIYPVASVNLVDGWACCFTAQLNSKGEMTYPGCGDVNAELTWHKANNAFGTAALKWSHTYGMVSDAGRFMRGCAVDIPSTVASGPSWPGGEWYGSHELGHTLNQVHTRGTTPAPCGACSKDECGPWSMCGCEGGATDHGRNGDISLTKTPYAGTTFYGFDIETLAIYPPDWKENMSYCNPEWISDYTYESIMDRIQWEGAHLAAAEISAPAEHLAVFGRIVTATQQVTLETFYRLPHTTDLIGREPGPYSIRLLGAGDAPLADYPFTPRWSHQDPGPACGITMATDDNPALIAEYVPWVAGTARVAIVYGGQELASRTVSAHAPTVTLLTPNGGGALTGETVTVAWSATDADGDALEFSVEYSLDGGASWRMVQSGLTATQTTLLLERLGGTTQGKFRVLATDGVNTAAASVAILVTEELNTSLYLPLVLRPDLP